MQVSVESTGTLGRRLTVEVGEEQIAEAVKSRLQNMTRTVKLKGFRPGKVPLRVVQQHYGKQVRQEVVGEVLQSSFYEAITQEKLKPAGVPDFEPKSSEEGKGLEYTATFEIYPEVQVASMADQTIEKQVATITDSDVDAMLETIRKQNQTWEVVDRQAKEGDQVRMDYQGTIEGKPFEGGDGKDMTVELGQGRMIAGFEDGLIGAKAGDSLTLNLTFPEAYHAKELAAKPVEFSVTVNTVAEAVLPEVDEDFAKRLGMADGGLETMRSEIQENMQRELDANVKSKFKRAVMDKLLEANELDIPQTLVENESQALLAQMKQNLERQGMRTEDTGSLQSDMFDEQARRRVILGLLMVEIVKANNLKAEPTKIRQMVEEIARPYEHPEEMVKWYYADKHRLAEVESMVVDEIVVEWLAGQATIVEKEISFKELMHPEQEQKKPSPK